MSENSNQLRRELPGLRGYSLVTTDETKTTIAIAEINSDKSSAVSVGNSTIARKSLLN